MKKVLIDNCVPLNNGDAALIFALHQNLKQGYEVELSCLKYELVKEKYPNFVWHKSHIQTFFQRVCFKKNLFVFFWKMVIFTKLVFFKNEYKDSDIIISAPGGYIHSYYGIEARMYILYICKKWLKKNVGIYSQSIGNLTERDQKIFYKYGKDLDFILVRDSVSLERINSYGEFKNIRLTKDAAFMLREPQIRKVDNIDQKRVAISLRSWNKEGRDMSQYFQLIKSVTDYLLLQNFNITFLSTCQGIDEYTDDSITAKEFVNQFKYSDQRINIDDKYHSLADLQTIIKDYDFVIGTRLHMCILSWINEVPAFNISYEEKGKEAFSYLGIDRYSVDFNSTDIVEKLDKFIHMGSDERQIILDKVTNVSEEQISIFSDLASSNFERKY
ncbi:polysaccharide pyruvyl transferase family protein [Enterococcus casseliflavus]|uniref:polysaccharide pyruvyl transferase family protein n=1 Tax=Enterococcus casseliflavus TaxID=37734 RepID=UPI0035CB1C49